MPSHMLWCTISRTGHIRLRLKRSDEFYWVCNTSVVSFDLRSTFSGNCIKRKYDLSLKGTTFTFLQVSLIIYQTVVRMPFRLTTKLRGIFEKESFSLDFFWFDEMFCSPTPQVWAFELTLLVEFHTPSRLRKGYKPDKTFKSGVANYSIPAFRLIVQINTA